VLLDPTVSQPYSTRNMTKQEFEFLVSRVEEMYCGDPNVDGVRALLDHIGAPYGFTVEDALETSPRRRVSDGLSSSAKPRSAS